MMRNRGMVIGIVALAALGMAASARQDKAPLRIHLISGSKEYKSEDSLKAFKSHLEQNYRVTCSASWASDGAKHLEELDALKKADLLFVFARRMKLPEEEMKVVRAHWEVGKPVIGVRTASHAFQKADNETFDRKVLGGNYTGHFGNEPVKVTNVPKVSDHPVLKGVEPFTSTKLYKAGELAPGVVVLQMGDIGKAQHAVTIVNTYKGGRTFYTSLGTPEDFKTPAFRRMLVNALFWTTKRDPAQMKKS